MVKKSARATTKVRKKNGKGSSREIKKMEDIINGGSIRHRALPWAELAAKAGLIGDKQVYFNVVLRVNIRGTSTTADSLYQLFTVDIGSRVP